jgi:VWFA-related protein
MQAIRIGLLIPVVAAGAFGLMAQQVVEPSSAPAAGEAVPTIHVTSRIVVLDVVVSDGKRHPVQGLKASDFALTEDGVPQTILSVTERDGASAEPLSRKAELPPDTFTVQPPVSGDGVKTVIVTSGFSSFIGDQLRDYFKSSPTTTPTAIFRMDWQGMHLVQSFTLDRDVLLEAAASKRIWPPLGFQVRFARVVGSPTRHLARFLAGVPGRINVIWINGGPVGEMKDLFPDVSNFVRDLKGITDVHRLSRVVPYTIDTAGPPVPAADWMDFGREIDDLKHEFNPEALSQNVIGLHDADAAFASVDLHDAVAGLGGRAFQYTNPEDALAQVAATGSHYYTISYRSSNSDWNGKFRNIHVDVDGFDEPPMTLRWGQLLSGWAEGFEPRLMYRRGYIASEKPATRSQDLGFGRSTAAIVPAGAVANDGSAQRRKLISSSPKGNPGPDPKAMEAAMGFAAPPPFQVQFTVVVKPSPQKQKTKPGEDLPVGNYLTGAFLDGAYRNYTVHYWVDPHDLKLLRTASGTYRDDLQFVAVVYRDDGLVANSAAYTTHIEVRPDDLEGIDASGVTFDQTLAIPTDGNYFLRVGVNEVASGHIGVLEIPTEWIKVVSAQTALTDQGR